MPYRSTILHMLLLALVACMVLSVSASGALDLTDENFKSTISSGTWFVKFHAPWCGHCKRLAPTWDQLAKDVAEDADLSQSVKLASVNCDENINTARDIGIQGYPTLALFQDGKKIMEYRQSRALDALKQFLKDTTGGRNSDGAVKDLTAENFNSHTSRLNERHFVMFYAPWCGHCTRLKPTWTELAEHFKGTKVHINRVDCTKEAALCREHGVRGYPTLKLLEGSKVYEYRGPRSLQTLAEWIEAKKYQSEKAEERAIAAPKVSFLEELVTNPHMLITLLVIIVGAIVALSTVILCCCIDGEDDLMEAAKPADKKESNSTPTQQTQMDDTSIQARVSASEVEMRKRTEK